MIMTGKIFGFSNQKKARGSIIRAMICWPLGMRLILTHSNGLIENESKADVSID